MRGNYKYYEGIDLTVLERMHHLFESTFFFFSFFFFLPSIVCADLHMRLALVFIARLTLHGLNILLYLPVPSLVCDKRVRLSCRRQHGHWLYRWQMGGKFSLV